MPDKQKTDFKMILSFFSVSLGHGEEGEKTAGAHKAGLGHEKLLYFQDICVFMDGWKRLDVGKECLVAFYIWV